MEVTYSIAKQPRILIADDGKSKEMLFNTCGSCVEVCHPHSALSKSLSGDNMSKIYCTGELHYYCVVLHLYMKQHEAPVWNLY